MKTGFVKAFVNIPGNKAYKYHGLNRSCDIQPDPDPLHDYYIGPGFGTFRLWYYLSSYSSAPYDQDGKVLVIGPNTLLRYYDGKWIRSQGNYWSIGGGMGRFSGRFDPLPVEFPATVESIKITGDVELYGLEGDGTGYLKIWFEYDTSVGAKEDLIGQANSGYLTKVYPYDPWTGLPWTKAQANSCRARYEIKSSSVYLKYPTHPYDYCGVKINDSYIEVC